MNTPKHGEIILYQNLTSSKNKPEFVEILRAMYGEKEKRLMHKSTAKWQMLGYLYQVQYALFHIIKNTDSFDSDTRIMIESYDDVAFEKEGIVQEILQTKHHISSTKNMTDLDIDFWKTLYNWIKIYEYLKSNRIPIPSFYLITTVTITNNQFVPFLGYDNRNINEAIDELDKLQSNSPSIEKYINKYNSLSPEDKKELLDKVYILSKSPQAKDITEDITEQLSKLILPNASESLIDEFIEWWYKACIDMLSKSGKLSFKDIQSRAQELQSRNSKKLKIYRITAEKELDKKSVFIEQLSIIDYHQYHTEANEQFAWAFHHRAEWINNGDITDTELIQYENRLSDEWNSQQKSIKEFFSKKEDKHSMINVYSIINLI